ncbi:MAG: hypothetical protein ING44_13770 [Telmatospirillum sp.]|nr:hypothetical protein [Telmatospirillum sp.]
MALSQIALCSRALIKLGAQPIASFAEGTVESQVAAALFPSVRDGLISAHPWSFASAQTTLPRLARDPVADHRFAYQLPPDFLRALSVGQGARGRGTAYRIVESALHTDSDGVVLSYIFRPDESAFPPFFDAALIAALAAEFCLPVTESTSRAELLYRLSENEFRRARLIDAQQETPQSLDDFSLVEVRR